MDQTPEQILAKSLVAENKLNKLIEEAENSNSRGESIRLYYKAQQKTANITDTLEETLNEEISKGKRDAA